MTSKALRWPALALAVTAAWGCGEDALDTTRETPVRGSFGAELFKVLQKDIARAEREPAARRDALDQQRFELVNAFDALLPEAELAGFTELLESLVEAGVYDDGTLPELTRALGPELARFAGDTLLLSSWEREGHRPGRLPRETTVLAHAADFPRLRELSLELLGFALARDGHTDTGLPAPDEPRDFADAIDALSSSLQSADPGEPASARLFADVVDFLLTEDPQLEVDSLPEYLVRRDRRGAFVPARAPDGSLPPPFTDGDGDGLADLDAHGAFAGLDPPLPAHVRSISERHDGLGRALLPGGDGETLAYQYVDLHQTVLRATLGGLHELVEADALFDLATVFPALADEAPVTGRPLLTLYNALAHVLDYEELPALLEALSIVLGDPTMNAGGLVQAFHELFEVAERHPEAQATPGHSFLEDLLELLAELAAEPGLVADLLREAALLDPELLSRSGAAMLNFTDAFVSEAEADRCLQGSFCEPVSRPVDRTRVDWETRSGDGPAREGNRSLFQRALHLVQDTAGLSYSLAPLNLGVTIWETDDVAAFYFDVIGGLSRDEPDLFGTLACVGETVSEVARITPGVLVDACPTPEQAGRFMNRELLDILADQELIDAEGYRLRLHHGDTLFALVVTGTTEALKPIARAFSRHGRSDLFSRLFALLHRHWASAAPEAVTLQADGTPAPGHGTDLRSYEPLLIDLLTQTRHLTELVRSARALAGATLATYGRPLPEVLEGAVRHLFVPTLDVRRRDGTSAWTRPDGAPRELLSRFQLLREAIAEADAALHADPTTADAWSRLSEALLAHLFDTEEAIEGESWVFRLRHIPVATAYLLQLLQRRTARELEGGDLHGLLLRTWPPELEALLTGRGLAAGLDLVAALGEASTLRRLVFDATLHLLDPAHLDDLAIVAIDLLHEVLEHDPREDPGQDARGYVAAAFAYGRALGYHPLSPLLPLRALVATKRLLELDGPSDRVGALLRRALAPRDPGGPWSIAPLGAALRRDQRLDPASGGPLFADDYAHLLTGLAAWLADHERGAEQLYELIARRE